MGQHVLPVRAEEWPQRQQYACIQTKALLAAIAFSPQSLQPRYAGLPCIGSVSLQLIATFML